MNPNLVIIVPACNEVENIPLLHEELNPVAKQLNARILIVDNGSSDGTKEAAQSFCCFDYIRIEVAGKTEALKAAIEESMEPLIATIDADLQEDPQDLLRMVEMIEDADFVQAVRSNRADSRIMKAIPSFLYNVLIKVLFGVNFGDINCGLRVFRREVVQHFLWFSGAHRLFPLMAHHAGKRMCLFRVKHRKRRYGQSKFSTSARFFSSIHDLLRVYKTLK